jgi:Fungal protein of unknown function (DUF1752)
MAQVDTHSAFRHSSPHHHNPYYYHRPSSSSHSSSSSSCGSHHSSPRSSSLLPTQHQQRYYTPPTSQSYSSEEHNVGSYHNPPYRSTYAALNPPACHSFGDQPSPNLQDSPFPAYDHAITSQTLSLEPVQVAPEEEDEEEYFEDDQEEAAHIASASPPDSFKSDSPTTPLPPISDDIWTERGPPPDRQVDYLSYDWQEPDIWSSWRYIRKERTGYLQNAARLENASWRTWAKSKYKLKTISPETLNWYLTLVSGAIHMLML